MFRNLAFSALVGCCATASLETMSISPFTCTPGLQIKGHSSSKKTSSTYDLTVMGPVVLNDGIGKQMVDLIETLDSSLKISCISTYTKITKIQYKDLPQRTRQVLDISGKSKKGKVLFYESPLHQGKNMAESYKYSFWKQFHLSEKDKRQIRIAYSMFESSAIPKSWVDIINQSFDAVAVPDSFLVNVYTSSGVTKPIFVVPLGRDLSAFLAAPIKTKAHVPFVFGTFNLCDRRKNTLKLVEAFAKTFGNSSLVKLRIGWRACHDDKYREEILDVIRKNHLQNVIIEEKSVNFPEHFARFNEIDCLVSIATGEGFSIQPREAMALGIPVIATDNTAQSTICASGLVRSVPSNIPIPAKYPWPGNFGVQYDCLTEDIADALRDVYTNYDTYLQNAPRCREWARQYHLPNTKAAYMSLIQPLTVSFGETDTILPNGFVTKNQKLFHKYQRLFFKQKRHKRH